MLRWILLLQEFDLDIKDKRGTENLVADHLSRLEHLKPDLIPIDDHFTYDRLIARINTMSEDDSETYKEFKPEKVSMIRNVP